MVDNDVSVLLTTDRIGLLLSFIAHPETHVANYHFFAGIEVDLMVFLSILHLPERFARQS